MKKVKQMIKYCFVFVAAVFGCIAFSCVSALETSQNISKAATPISLYANLRERSNGVVVTNPEIKNSDWVFASSSQKQIVLALTHDKFNYYSNETTFAGDELDAPSNGTSLIHKSGLISNVTGNDTANVTKNGQFVTNISLPVAIQNAMTNGAIVIDSSAKLSSNFIGNVGFWGLGWKDSPEKITMEIVVYNDASSAGTNVKSFVHQSTMKSDDFQKAGQVSANGALSFSKSELSGFEELDYVSLSFKSEINGDCYNSMQIDNPVVKFSTDDVVAPTISYNSEELNTGWVNSSKVLKIAATDAYSGISAVYVNGTEVDATFSNKTKNATYNYNINENGTYVIEVIDNVGNKTTETYTETKIDKVKPSANIEIAETFTNKAVTFIADIVPSQLSIDTFSVNYTATELFGQKMKTISGSQLFADGENTINFAENGKYTLTFAGVDEAGNAMTEIVMYIEIDDRTVVILQVEENYIYNASGFTPNYTASVDGDYIVKFSYETEDGNSISSINKIGTYTANYVIDAYAYKGSGSQAIFVSPKEVTISNFELNYVYTGNVIVPLFEQSEDILLSIKFYQEETESDFINAGLYVCEIEPVSDNYYISNGSYDVVINKQLLTLSNIKDSFIYDKQTKTLDFDLSNMYQKSNILVSYYDANKNPISVDDIINAGDYYATFEFIGDTENYEFNSYLTIETAYAFKINKREIAVNVISQNLIYGDILAELDYFIENVLDIEPLIFSLSTNYNKNVGTYDIIVDQKYSQTAEESEILSNYDVIYNEGKIVVSKKAITIIPSQKQSKIYGEADKTLSYSVSGLVYGDVLTGELSREMGESIGYYNITIGTIANENYEISVSSERFEILKRMAFIFIHNVNKIYGEADPEITFNESASNFTIADLEVLKTLNLLVREAGENVGTYNIRVNDEAIKTANIFDNYNILSLGARLTISKAKVYASAENKFVTYGDSAELTYVFTEKTTSDNIELELVREEGENVGEYQIDCKIISFDNYDIIFTPAVYSISQRQITITANDSSKIYGENDVFAYEVSNAVEELDINIIREAGENVGEYMIYGFEINNANYKVIEFKTAKFVIEKATIAITINNSVKTYGEIDPIVDYTIDGLVFGDKLNLNVVREDGENSGEYEITCEIIEFENYVIKSVSNGKLLINKADYSYTLPNFTTIYNGNAVNLQVFDFEFELEYSFTDAVGSEVDAPINAGEYIVSAYFAGNENYNPFKTNTSTLIIEKKVIPITLKKNVFLYNGKAQAPEYDINLENPVSVIIEYEGSADPIEIGDYGFKIISNNPNYVCSYSSILKIVSEFYNEDENGSSVSTSNVSFASSGIQINKNLNSKYMSMFNTIFDGRKCLAVYEFEGGSNAVDGEVFTVKIKATGKTENVQIYILDGNGKLTPVSYVYSNGYYVLSVNTLTADILITETNAILKYAKIIAVITVLALSFFITKIVNRRRKNSFFARNTSVRMLDKDYVKKHMNIVYERVNYDKKVSVKSIIKK